MTPDLSTRHRTEHPDAEAHMDAEWWNECIKTAKYNLPDPRLSRYWRMKHLPLIINVSDNWYEAER